MVKKFECPLCESTLSESRYYEIIGVWEEKKKFEQDLKKQLAISKQTKEKLLQERKEIRQKLIKEKAELKKKFEEQKSIILKKTQEEANKLVKKNIDKLNKEKFELERKNKRELIRAKKEALEKGKKYEKSRADKLSNMLQGKMKDIEKNQEIIKELKEQLKKGTTPQIEGLNLEEELVKELKGKFPSDRIERHGHGGDILHYITHNSKEIGLIVYECKKTQKFQKKYITQIKNDVAKRNATYGVLITTASEKNKAGFWVDNDILIVHPYGTIYIAEVLRKWIINFYDLKLDKKELSECAKKLLEYIKSDKFKNCVQDSIHRIRELNEILKKEITTHKNSWEKRHDHYARISENSQNIEEDSKTILKHEERELKEIESEPEIMLTIPRKKRKKKQVDY